MTETTEVKQGYVEYNSNNSGGDWWLKDKDWRALEKAGWEVDWYRNKTGWNGGTYEDGRFLGALATKATRYGLSLRAAVAEWEKITGQCATDVGCPCCGQPHSFTEYDAEGNYIRSGPERNISCSWEEE